MDSKLLANSPTQHDSDHPDSGHYGVLDLDVIVPRQPWLVRILPPYTSGSADTVFGIAVYGRHHDTWWSRWLLRPYHHWVLGGIDKMYWWLRDRLISRHHVVRTGLRPGWCDVDEVMFRACFVLLGRFVEGELGKAEVDAAPDEHHRWYRLHCLGGTDEAAIDLWYWYRDELPVLETSHDFTDLETIKQDKLEALIKLRRALWT